jgi:hypothetical protein
MSEQKQEKKQPVLIRLEPQMFDTLFERAARAQLDRRLRVSVPSLVVEQLEFVLALQTHHPEIYEAAKAAVERTNKS